MKNRPKSSVSKLLKGRLCHYVTLSCLTVSDAITVVSVNKQIAESLSRSHCSLFPNLIVMTVISSNLERKSSVFHNKSFKSLENRATGCKTLPSVFNFTRRVNRVFSNSEGLFHTRLWFGSDAFKTHDGHLDFFPYFSQVPQQIPSCTTEWLDTGVPCDKGFFHPDTAPSRDTQQLLHLQQSHTHTHTTEVMEFLI